MQGIILTQGTPDRCIRAYPLDAFEQQAALYLSQPVTTREGRVARRAYFSVSYQAELDRQGRVLIPPALRQFAGLEGQVTIVGTGEGIEIWNAAGFEETLEDEAPEFIHRLEPERG